MDTLLFSLNAVLPILLLLGLGYILKRTHFLDEHFLQVGNKFVFRIARVRGRIGGRADSAG